ncbi:MAG: hypothetical protein RL557_413 [archaeon]|jgi:hypothetical protein
MTGTIETNIREKNIFAGPEEPVTVQNENISVGNYIVNDTRVEWIVRITDSGFTTLSPHSDWVIKSRYYFLYNSHGELKADCPRSGLTFSEEDTYKVLKNKIEAYRQLGAGI